MADPMVVLTNSNVQYFTGKNRFFCKNIVFSTFWPPAEAGNQSFFYASERVHFCLPVQKTFSSGNLRELFYFSCKWKMSFWKIVLFFKSPWFFGKSWLDDFGNLIFFRLKFCNHLPCNDLYVPTVIIYNF